MTIDPTTLQQIVAQIVEMARPTQVILFGSAATGKMTRDSDIDLLVIEPEVYDTRQESLRIREALGDVSWPVDIVVMAQSRFEETKSVVGGIAYPAHKYGKVLYEAA